MAMRTGRVRSPQKAKGYVNRGSIEDPIEAEETRKRASRQLAANLEY